MLWSIYCIENKIDGKRYVGQTVKTLDKRFSDHVRGSRRKNASLISKAIKKHGIENFTVTLLCQLTSQAEADAKEIELIEEFQTRDRSKGYNIAIGGVCNVMTGLRMPEEMRLKISFAHKGKKLSEEHCQKISQIQMGNKKRLGKMHSSETKQKISEALSGRKLSEEWRSAISEGMKGHSVSQETRVKISTANRGKIRTEEIRRRISEKHKGKKQSPEVIEKRIAPLRGRPRSEEVRRKISEGNRGKEGLRGEVNGASKLTEDQVREIKRLFADGARNIDIMRQFGMSKGTIANIKCGRSWSHVILSEGDTQ